MHNKTMILPSILSADFSQLGNNIQEVTGAGATMLHLDVMDGHFVPNISFGPAVVKAIDAMTDAVLDTHLMVSNPDLYIDTFKKSGSDILTVHVEACQHLHRTISRIKDLGLKAGVSLNPATPLSSIEEILPSVDLVLIMSVNPGFGGQKFIASSIDKISRLKKMIQEQNLSTIIEVDGGIDETTIQNVANAGARYLVAGNAVFGKGTITTNYHNLQHLLP